MKKVIIIGGGFAGLSAGTALAEKGYHVTLLEGRQVLGGRAYSFVDAKKQDAVDNGQHLFMRCYHQTQKFLKRIGTLNRLRFQLNLSTDFVDALGRTAKLRCLPLPAPWHLLSGLLLLSTLSWGDKWRMRHMRQALKEAEQNPDAVESLTVEQWLIRWKQSDRARRHFWDLIAIATLNENPKVASAGAFATVLAKAFFGARRDSQLGFADVGLSELYVQAAKSFIEERGGQVRVKTPVERLILEHQTVRGVQLREGGRLTADWVISAVPAPAFLKLVPETEVAAHPIFQRLRQLKSASIISIHLWFDRAVCDQAFVGLLDTQAQWFFNRSAILSDSKTHLGYTSVVISGAHAFIDWQENRILAMVMEELRRVFPRVRKALLERYVVIKEHHATLSPEVGSEALRPDPHSPYQGLLLAGDWTRTGLPATIESACISGHSCADLIQKHASEHNHEMREAVHA